MTLIDNATDVINQYQVLTGGRAVEVVPGGVGYGITICTAPGYKSCVIRERYLNEWSSGHTARFYRVLPKKYQKMLGEVTYND